MGLFTDGAGHACALVGTTNTSYAQCIDGEQPTGLAEIATNTNDFLTPSSRIVSAAQDDATIFYSYGPFAALYGVQLMGGTYNSFELFESSISFPGAAATAGGVAYACFIGSDDGARRRRSRQGCRQDSRRRHVSRLPHGQRRHTPPRRGRD